MHTRIYSILVFLTLFSCFSVQAQWYGGTGCAGVRVSLDTSATLCEVPATVSILLESYKHGNCSTCGYQWSAFELEWSDGLVDTAYRFGGTVNYNYSHTRHADTVITRVFNDTGDYHLHVTRFDFGCIILEDEIQFRVSPHCNTVTGKLYLDSDSSCTYSGGDTPQNQAGVMAIDKNGLLLGHGISDTSGNYLMKVGQYHDTVFISPSNSVVSPLHCDSAEHVALPELTADTILDFPVIFKDMDFFPLMRDGWVAPPGDTGRLKLFTFGKGNVNDDAVMRLSLDSNVTYAGMVYGPPPDSIFADELVWKLAPNANNQHIVDTMIHCKVFIRTKTTATIFDWTRFRLSVDLHPQEKKMNNNHHTRDFEIGGPYDPNNKLVSPAGATEEHLVWPEVELTYTINFQNTGTAPAVNVYILDSLSDMLDHSTIEILASSHPMEVTYFPDWPMRFDFKNINLPDSNSNEPESHGWFMFSVKVKDTLQHGDRVENFVDIYFDYNAPIRTNTAFVTIDTGYYPKLSASATPNLCVSNDIGTATAVVKEGASSYNMKWNTGSSEETITELATGTYTVTLQDENFYTVRTNATVTEDRHIDVFPGFIDGPVYPEARDSVEYSVPFKSNINYTWSALGGDVVNASGNEAVIIWGDTNRGQLRVTATDSVGCESFSTHNVFISPTGIGNDQSSQEFVISPNPAYDIVRVSSSRSIDSIELMDSDGKVVYDADWNESQGTIKLTQLPAGNYFVRILSASSTYTSPLIIK